MATWKKVLVVGLAVLVGALFVLAQRIDVKTTPAQPATVPLPQGQELPDEELLGVDGEWDPLTVIAAGVVSAGIAAASDLIYQGIQIARGKQPSVDWEELGIVAGVGLLTTPLNLSLPVTKVVRSAIVTGARWTARAAATVGAAASSFGHKVHEALHTVHVALHTYVSEPVRNAFRKAWDWLLGRR